MSSNQHLPKLNGRVLWLIPSDSFFTIYQKEIKRLAGQFKTVPFTPHLTLGGLPDAPLESTISKVRNVFNKKQGDFSMSHKSVDCSTSPYQNFIHSLLPNTKMHLLQSVLKVVLTNYSPKSEYHISLMYGQISCEKLTKESDSLTIKLPKKIRFTGVRMIELAERPELWKTVWETNI